MYFGTRKSWLARVGVASTLLAFLSLDAVSRPNPAFAEAKKKNAKASSSKSTPKKESAAKGDSVATASESAAPKSIEPTSTKVPPSNEKSGDKNGGSSGNALKDALGGKSSSGSAPLYIKSDTLSLDSKGRVFTYRNNVQVQRDDLLITADTVEGRYDDSNQIQNVLATGNVVITKGDGLKATSNRAIYFVPQAKIELTEAPELYRGGNALAADKVTIFVNEDRSEAEGNVRVKVLKDAAGAQNPAGG